MQHYHLFTLPALNELSIMSNSCQRRYDRKWPKDLFAAFLSRIILQTDHIFHPWSWAFRHRPRLCPSASPISNNSSTSAIMKLYPKISPITSDLISTLHSSAQSELTKI
ncbi:hypothetical protein BT96DRAFT_228483 [Gymnopus androsaceus JB14]|uniref:Uncharacterized protein n=1 Tax=Gymnopus androsaceus JB14 TaxID=1447944 RepID=A0A6A4H689_9AGAR|nr:hypothetical protein BT96DRAFT_228483 [Gymnopus androsaceus JB14]